MLEAPTLVTISSSGLLLLLMCNYNVNHLLVSSILYMQI